MKEYHVKVITEKREGKTNQINLIVNIAMLKCVPLAPKVQL